MQQILIASHCLLNTAAKLKRFDQEEIESEEALRRRVLKEAIDRGVQIVQLPCPEFLLYGSRRWGHTYDQFNNAFFKDKCREVLTPVLLQIREYLDNPQEFELLGVLGIDGSPSCGVKYTCRAMWGGEFSGRDVSPVLAQCKLEEGSGVMMEVLKEMLEENGIDLPIEGLFAPEAERIMALLDGKAK